MKACHKKLQDDMEGMIDDIYYSPYHPSITKSLSRKPGTLLFEKAISKWKISPHQSWMIGDKPSDLEPALTLGMRVIGVDRGRKLKSAEFIVRDIKEVPAIITQNSVRQD